jgi:CRP-like cAMP-binding protein
MSDVQHLDVGDHARFDRLAPLSGTGASTAIAFSPGDILPERTLLVLSGWAGRRRFLTDGRRQILNLVLPGDVCGLFADAGAADPVVALTRLQATLGTFPMELMDSESSRGGGGTDPARRLLAFERWCIFNQLMRLGAMQAKERTAHLLLELYHRLACVKLAEDFVFELPLTQEQLANVLGLSAVHVNRTLQALRHEGLIECRGFRVRISKPDDLAELANFNLPAMLECRV